MSGIIKILDNNKIEHLSKFIKKRSCLKQCNICLIYMFHITQSFGILITTVGAGDSNKLIIWSGIGLNVLASLLHVIINTNNAISENLYQNIVNIQSGTFIDETPFIEPSGNHSTEYHTTEYKSDI